MHNIPAHTLYTPPPKTLKRAQLECKDDIKKQPPANISQRMKKKQDMHQKRLSVYHGCTQ